MCVPAYVCACMCVRLCVWHHIVYCRMNLRDHMLSLERINCKGPPDWATASSGAPAPIAAPPLSRTTQQMVATLASVDVSPSFLHMQKCEKIDIKRKWQNLLNLIWNRSGEKQLLLPLRYSASTSLRKRHRVRRCWQWFTLPYEYLNSHLAFD